MDAIEMIKEAKGEYVHMGSTSLQSLRVNLLLLAVDLCIELVEQVFGKACFDFQVNQAVFNRGWNVHGLYWT